MSLKKTIYFFVFIAIAFLPSQMLLLGSEEFRSGVYNNVLNQDSVDRGRSVEIIEEFLTRPVPGLDVSYREFFDTMINDGFQVYLMGGVLRDLLSNPKQEVNDIDFNFLAPKEELVAFMKKHRWQYTTLPNSAIVTIGDNDGNQHTLEGRSTTLEYMKDDNNYEFTVNEIFYNLKDRTFLPNYENSREDIRNKRLRISAQDWKVWFRASMPYKKVLRFWKMTGKGYIYPVEVENYVRNLVQEAMKNDADAFNKEIVKYIGTHYSGFEDVVRGCKNTMGQEWCESVLLSKKNLIIDKDTSFKKKQASFTYKPGVDF